MSPPTFTNDTVPQELIDLIPTIAERLSQLDDAQPYLFVEIPASGRYLQLTAVDENLRGESVGNTYLSVDDSMNAQELEWLAGHGWNEPDKDGNHWRNWEPADPLAAALVTIVTLHQVHHVTRASQIVLASTSPCESDFPVESIVY